MILKWRRGVRWQPFENIRENEKPSPLSLPSLLFFPLWQAFTCSFSPQRSSNDPPLKLYYIIYILLNRNGDR
jgi:hypothetical protein